MTEVDEALSIADQAFNGSRPAKKYYPILWSLAVLAEEIKRRPAPETRTDHICGPEASCDMDCVERAYATARAPEVCGCPYGNCTCCPPDQQ